MQRFREDGVCEPIPRGGSISPLGTTTVNSGASQTYTALGLRLAAPGLSLAGMPLDLHGDLGWSHALEDLTPGQLVSFATGRSFTLLGVPLGSDAATLQFGLDLAVAPAALLTLGYDASLSNRGSSHAIRGGLVWRF